MLHNVKVRVTWAPLHNIKFLGDLAWVIAQHWEFLIQSTKSNWMLIFHCLLLILQMTCTHSIQLIHSSTKPTLEQFVLLNELENLHSIRHNCILSLADSWLGKALCAVVYYFRICCCRRTGAFATPWREEWKHRRAQEWALWFSVIY